MATLDADDLAAILALYSNPTAAAAIRAALGMTTNNLDTQLGNLPASVAALVSAAPVVSFVVIPGDNAPSTKRIELLAATGGTYNAARVVRAADGYLLDHADGVFRASPATPSGALVEVGTSGRYKLDENAEKWDDGTYTVVVTNGSGAIVGGAFVRLSGDLATAAAAPGLLEYALTDLAALKTELRIPSGETAEDTRLVAAINEATEAIEGETGRRVKRRAANAELYFDVEEDDNKELWPDHWPFDAANIVSLQTVAYGDFTSASVVTYAADEFRVEGRQRIVLMDDVTPFYPGTQTVKLIFTPGYVTPLADIAGVCKSKAARIFWRDKGAAAGLDTETVGDRSVTRKAEAWTPEEKAVLAKYTRGPDYIRKRKAGTWLR